MKNLVMGFVAGMTAAVVVACSQVDPSEAIVLDGKQWVCTEYRSYNNGRAVMSRECVTYRKLK